VIESIFYRVIEGRIPYKGGLYIYDPSFRVKSIGQNIYNDIVKFHEDDILTDRDINILLMQLKLWDSDKEKRIKDIPLQLENQKVHYFNNYFLPSARSGYLTNINKLQEEMFSLFRIKGKYNYMTQEGIAASAMWYEMIRHMYKGHDYFNALAFYHANSIDEDTIRDLARSDIWSSYSSISKTPLKKRAIEMTEYQKKLMMWTNIYKNVRSHPEFPGDKVLGDHYAFDGWMIVQSRKEKAEKANKVQIGNLKPNTKNVFISAKSRQDFNEVMALNSPEALAEIRGII
jgi:hypothetical protein